MKATEIDTDKKQHIQTALHASHIFLCVTAINEREGNIQAGKIYNENCAPKKR